MRYFWPLCANMEANNRQSCSISIHLTVTVSFEAFYFALLPTPKQKCLSAYLLSVPVFSQLVATHSRPPKQESKVIANFLANAK